MTLMNHLKLNINGFTGEKETLVRSVRPIFSALVPVAVQAG